VVSSKVVSRKVVNKTTVTGREIAIATAIATMKPIWQMPLSLTWLIRAA